MTFKIFRARAIFNPKSPPDHIDVEIMPEAVELAKLYRRIAKKRFLGRTLDEQACIDGYLGQIAFKAMLIRLKIPYLPHDPIYSPLDPYYGLPYDFHIDRFGTIEVKTTARMRHYTRFMANKKLWDENRSNYAVGVKVRSDEKAVIVGWLKRDEVEALDVSDFGTGDAYYCNLSSLHPMPTFIMKLPHRD
jgi:hypothetical protein